MFRRSGWVSIGLVVATLGAVTASSCTGSRSDTVSTESTPNSSNDQSTVPEPVDSTSPSTVPTPTTNATTTTVAPEPVWQEQFDGPQGASPDPATWSFETGGDGWGNEQLQYYTKEAAVLDGAGNLVITSQPSVADLPCWYGTCQFESARLTTFGTFAQQYGHFETRLLLPGGRATWPAVWMMGANRYQVGWPQSGELDIVEHVGRDDGAISGAAHGPGYSGEDAISGDADVDPDQFHVYAIDWSPERVIWSVDGEPFHELTKDDVDEWVFDQPFFVLITLAVGGTHAGEPRKSDQKPQQLVVDYVRVYADPQLGQL